MDYPHSFAILMSNKETNWLAAEAGKTRYFETKELAEQERQKINGSLVVTVYDGISK